MMTFINTRNLYNVFEIMSKAHFLLRTFKMATRKVYSSQEAANIILEAFDDEVQQFSDIEESSDESEDELLINLCNNSGKQAAHITDQNDNSQNQQQDQPSNNNVGPTPAKKAKKTMQSNNSDWKLLDSSVDNDLPTVNIPFEPKCLPDVSQHIDEN